MHAITASLKTGASKSLLHRINKLIEKNNMLKITGVALK